MRLLAPKLVEGYNLRRLSVAEGKGTYRFKLTREACFAFNECLWDGPKSLSFQDNCGREWLRINSLYALVSRGYAWNGNSPKRGIHLPLIGDTWLGAPDYNPGNLVESLIHDACFQFSFLSQFPFALGQVNGFYCQLAADEGFEMLPIYKEALNMFAYRYWAQPTPGYRCIVSH